jgi:hypothetical protein
VRRELVRQGHRSTAWWYPSHDELATLLRGATGAQPAEPEHVDPARAVVVRAAVLPHFTAADPTHTIHAGRDVAKIIDRFILTLRLREAASQSGEIRFGRLPDYLVHDGHRWTAIELRFDAPAEDWASRLETYRRLGVTQVEVHTDHPVLAHILGRLGDRADTPQVRARFWTTTELDQST